MKIILYMAITVNGFIGLPDGNSDWVIEEDWKEFSKFIRDCGIVVMAEKLTKCVKKNSLLTTP